MRRRIGTLVWELNTFSNQRYAYRLFLHLEHWKIIAPTHVNIALQPEDGERIVQQFAITTTLWDVLRGFEAKG